MRVIFFSFLLLGVACKNNKNATAEAEKPQTDTVVVVVEKPTTAKDSTLLYFEKTACFGRCPVYKVSVFESGFAIYEGINFAEMMGTYSTQFTKQEINKVVLIAVEIGYFKLDSSYNNPQVSDLPSTISAISYDGMSHRVDARINIPEPLTRFHENLSVTLLERNWQPYSEK